jgi:hypothetical protein
VVVHTPVIPALVTLRQMNDQFEASLGYIERPCFKKKKKLGEAFE